MTEQERELDLLVAELEQENRLLRSRNERLERELAEALAEPVQEPVAWWKRHHDGSVELNEGRTFIAEDAIATGRRPLVFGDTAPPQRKPLTEEEIGECLPMGIAPHSTVVGRREIMRFARAIERAHGIKE